MQLLKQHLVEKEAQHPLQLAISSHLHVNITTVQKTTLTVKNFKKHFYEVVIMKIKPYIQTLVSTSTVDELLNPTNQMQVTIRIQVTNITSMKPPQHNHISKYVLVS